MTQEQLRKELKSIFTFNRLHIGDAAFDKAMILINKHVDGVIGEDYEEDNITQIKASYVSVINKEKELERKRAGL